MIVLDITEDVPSEAELSKWMAEPLRAVILPVSIFMTNRKGYPVLSQSHQQLLRRVLRVR